MNYEDRERRCQRRYTVCTGGSRLRPYIAGGEEGEED